MLKLVKNTVSLLKIAASLKNTCLKHVVPFVVLLHSIYLCASISSLVPLTHLIALAVSLIDKSNEFFDFATFVYLSILALASTTSIGLLIPRPASAINASTSPLL